MIVVVIISLLASLAIPLFNNLHRNAQNKRFMSDLRTFRDALDICVSVTGNMDQGSGSGTVAPELQGFVSGGANAFSETPLGGLWDVEYNKSGVTLGVGVHNYTASAEQILEIDTEFDDGSTASGNMRIIAGGRYYWVLID